MDDVFSLIKKDRAEKFLVHLNSQDENIRFTYEKEEDHHLPFLDVQVAGLEKSAAIRPFATKKSSLASETFLLADSLTTESCCL